MLRETRYKRERQSRDSRDFRKFIFYSVMVSLFIIALSLKRCLGPAFKSATYIPAQKQTADSSFKWTTFVRDYTSHAKCRMECRHINDNEVQDILQNGSVNIAKSELTETDCHRRFAIDGYSKENQHLRIVASPCGNKLTIITCIDLDKKWPCECGEVNQKTKDEY